ncbi:hypothetical protein NP233_g11021 [Leucocoprinus birnbaumii]|uniref:Uncharacterized protein n=1 Tax=Leucocoprinus birnbaumii TaxID=56174 RepID=A0AAD5YPB8_9AGAR|nr:hypothetical protein NP233_g11021 [Leucocoprinus birnbaumii]
MASNPDISWPDDVDTPPQSPILMSWPIEIITPSQLPYQPACDVYDVELDCIIIDDPGSQLGLGSPLPPSAIGHHGDALLPPHFDIDRGTHFDDNDRPSDKTLQVVLPRYHSPGSNSRSLTQDVGLYTLACASLEWAHHDTIYQFLPQVIPMPAIDAAACSVVGQTFTAPPSLLFDNIEFQMLGFPHLDVNADILTPVVPGSEHRFTKGIWRAMRFPELDISTEFLTQGVDSIRLYLPQLVIYIHRDTVYGSII